MCLYLCAAQPTEIFLRILAVFVAELLVVLLYIVEISMEIGLFVCLDKTAGNVGAMVGNTLKIGENILEYIAQLYGTFVILETADVPVLELCAQVVHHFLKRLYLMGDGKVVLNV